MPTNMGTEYQLIYNLGPADKRGVTAAKRDVCDILREQLGHGANSLEHFIEQGEAKLRFTAIETSHPDLMNHPYRVADMSGVVNNSLYDDISTRKILYRT